MKNILHNIKNWLWPYVCAICEEEAESTQDLCCVCRASLPWIEDRCYCCALPLTNENHSVKCASCLDNAPKFDRVCALFSYELPVSSLVMGLKFGKQLAYGRILGELLAEAVSHTWYTSLSLPEIIIPVPLHEKRLRKRGFNQALELARPIQKHLNIPIMNKAIQRVRATTPQSSLKRTSRKRNLTNAFEIKKTLPFEHVAIIDDVVTTGSTVSALSFALKQAGVERVDVWCVCRA